MAYRIIFKDVKNTIREVAILDGVPNVGDDVAITYRDQNGHLTGEQVAFPVKHRTFAYEKFNRPADEMRRGVAMHLTTVHVLLDDPVQSIVFEVED